MKCKILNEDEKDNLPKAMLSSVKILAFESGGDWADASVDYMVNVSGRTGEELNNEYKNNGGYHGNGKCWFMQWSINMGYCRQASDDELEVLLDL
jgi:hypothetical protein